MAFTLYNWSEVSVSLNQGLVSAAMSTESSDTVTLQGSMNIFSYYSLDAVATIEAVDYFLPQVNSLALNDIIFITGSDASAVLQVSAITQPDNNGNGATVSTASFAVNGSIGTANIQNLAVTTGKIALLAVTNAQIAANTIGLGQLANTVIQVAQISLTAAQIKGMYAAPVVVLASQGVGTFIIVDKVVLDIAYGTMDFANGGAIQVQYGSTVDGAGPAASASIAAATLNAVAASSQLTVGSTAVVAADTACIATGLYLSNATAPFITGDSTANLYVYYRVLTPA